MKPNAAFDIAPALSKKAGPAPVALHNGPVLSKKRQKAAPTGFRTSCTTEDGGKRLFILKNRPREHKALCSAALISAILP